MKASDSCKIQVLIQLIGNKIGSIFSVFDYLRVDRRCDMLRSIFYLKGFYGGTVLRTGAFHSGSA
jgi:hypothetical protein